MQEHIYVTATNEFDYGAVVKHRRVYLKTGLCARLVRYCDVCICVFCPAIAQELHNLAVVLQSLNVRSIREHVVRLAHKLAIQLHFHLAKQRVKLQVD